MILQLVVEKFIVHSPSAPHKWRILELKENYDHVMHNPTERSQGVV